MATIAVRTDTVERFTGDLTKVGAFLLRFEGRARKLRHWRAYTGALVAPTAALQSEVDAISDAAAKAAA